MGKLHPALGVSCGPGTRALPSGSGSCGCCILPKILDLRPFIHFEILSRVWCLHVVSGIRKSPAILDSNKEKIRFERSFLRKEEYNSLPLKCDCA